MGHQVTHELWTVLHQDPHRGKEEKTQQTYLRKQETLRKLPGAQSQGNQPKKELLERTRKLKAEQEKQNSWWTDKEERGCYQWLLQESVAKGKAKNNSEAVFWEQDKKRRVPCVVELLTAEPEENDKLLKGQYEVHNWIALRDQSAKREAEHVIELEIEKQATGIEIGPKLSIIEVQAVKADLEHNLHHHWGYQVAKRSYGVIALGPYQEQGREKPPTHPVKENQTTRIKTTKTIRIVRVTSGTLRIRRIRVRKERQVQKTHGGKRPQQETQDCLFLKEKQTRTGDGRLLKN